MSGRMPKAAGVALLFAAWGSAPAVAQDPVDVHGFLEYGVGTRVVDDPLHADELLLNEARLQLDLTHYGDVAELAFKGDFVSDGVSDDVEIDIRQATVSLRATDWLDVRAGRQILTWGTGDLVFLNDLFPKDFVSFFVGRDDEYLKAPANAVRLTAYSGLANLDVVLVPVFEPDRAITGRRLSYFDPGQGELVSASTSSATSPPTRPDRKARNGELAARLFRTVAGYELALYGYAGFTKQPLALDGGGAPTYSRLAVYGASVRGSLAGGITNVEGAYYDGADDAGDTPTVPNGQVRGLVGYTRELWPNMTGGFQYYAEHTLKHENLLAASPLPAYEPARTRHLVTTRLTLRSIRQTLTTSLFAFFSPNDGDAHLRPSMAYDWSDGFRVALGANVMLGDDHTFFGQLERATNVYLRGRYRF